MNLTSPERYKHTDLYRSLVDSKKITANSTHDEHMYIPNHQTTSNTWDAKHLDTFLKKSPWASSTGMTTTHAISSQDNKNKPKFNSQKSHFFRTGPRFSPRREEEYIFNLFKDFSYKEAKNNTNALVTLNEVDPVRLEHHYTKNFTLSNRNFDPSKLEFSSQPNLFMSPQNRRIQILQTSQEQKEFAAWKAKAMDISKKKRVYNNAYRNGILGVDNPLNEKTLIYKEEHEKLKNFHEERNKIEERRSKEITRWSMTNGMIEFDNQNFNPKLVEPPRTIVSGNTKLPIKSEYTEAWKDTHNRLFSGIGTQLDKYSIPRAQLLRHQENRGRNWDIVTWANTDIKIKQQSNLGYGSPSNKIPSLQSNR